MIRVAAGFLLVAAIVLAGGPVRAQSQSQSQSAKKKSAGGISATVVTDGALVYAAPDEDSSILTQLPQGQRVRISKGTTSGLQKFHKIAVGKKVGYIDDIDVSLTGAGSPKRPKKKKKPNAAANADKDDDKKRKEAEERRKRLEEMKPREPMAFSRFVGIEVGASQFKEGIAGVDSSTIFAIYGIKLTGPDLLFHGPIMDYNLLIHYGAPSYYSGLSSIEPDGFVILLDGLLIAPWLQSQNSMLYFGIGPVLMFSKFDISNANRIMSLEELDVGLEGELGAGFRFGKAALRLEAKYYLIKRPDIAALMSLQTGF